MRSGAVTSLGPERSRAAAHRFVGHVHRPSVNITAPERLGRFVVGLAGVVGGALLLASTTGAMAGVLEILLILAGLDLIATGAIGHCPLYQKLGYLPASLRRPR